MTKKDEEAKGKLLKDENGKKKGEKQREKGRGMREMRRKGEERRELRGREGKEARELRGREGTGGKRGGMERNLLDEPIISNIKFDTMVQNYHSWDVNRI